MQAFDEVAADEEALALASDKFQDLLKVRLKLLGPLPGLYLVYRLKFLTLMLAK